MSVDAAAGTPQRANEGLIPELFADEFNVEYYETTLLPKITTGKFYEGLLSKGDKVTVATLPTIQTHDYEKHQALTVDLPESTPIEMPVDRAKYFNFLIDAVDAKQSHLAIGDKYKNKAVEDIKEVIERQFFAYVYSQAHARNQGATAGLISAAFNLGTADAPLAVTKDSAVEFITKFSTVLGEQSAAQPGKMFIVIPHWMRYLFVNSDLKNASLTGDDKSVMRTGRLGEVDGITIYASNLLYMPTAGATTTYVIGGNMDAISYISQLNTVETLKSERYMGKLYRGLYVYDWYVRKPEGLVVAAAYKG